MFIFGGGDGKMNHSNQPLFLEWCIERMGRFRDNFYKMIWRVCYNDFNTPKLGSGGSHMEISINEFCIEK